MESSHLTEIWAAIGGAIGALTFFRPVFIWALDKYLFPNIDDVFTKLNREAPDLLKQGTGEDVYNIALGAIKAQDKKRFFTNLAYERLMSKYRLDINVKELRKTTAP